MQKKLRIFANLKNFVIVICSFLFGSLSSANTVISKNPHPVVFAQTNWSPNRFNLVSQFTAEIDETATPVPWEAFVQSHAGRLKALQVSWDDFRSALNSSTRFRPLSTVDPKMRQQYEDILSAATANPTIDFNRPENRSFKTLTTKIWAVHSTDYFPQNKIGLAPVTYYFRPTIHFSLGGLVRAHHSWSWENKKFAVLVPLAELLPQLLNLMPQDSFIAGEFELPTSAIVLAPVGSNLSGFKLEKAELRLYDLSQKTLRVAINEVLKEKGAWLIKSHPENTTPLPRAYVDGVNIYQYPFFAEFFKVYPKVRFGSHINSLTENITYAGVADNIDTGLSYLPVGNYMSASILFLKEAFDGLLEQIQISVESEAIRKDLFQRYLVVRPQLMQNFFSRFKPDRVGSGNNASYDMAIGHFLAAFDSETAEKVIRSLPRDVGFLNTDEQIIKQKITRLFWRDLASGPNPGVDYEAVEPLFEQV